MSDLVNALTTLGLRHTAAHLDDVIALATKRRWSTTQLLEHLVPGHTHPFRRACGDVRRRAGWPVVPAASRR